jgi:hypothetical protein
MFIKNKAERELLFCMHSFLSCINPASIEVKAVKKDYRT